jgi:alpha-beta hydrolase superfamily lysophospholipase
MPIVSRAPGRAWTAIFMLWLATVAALSGPLFPFTPLPSEAADAVAKVPDIDVYLREREARHPDVRRDLAKTIQWSDPAHGTTPLSLVYVHGFSASRKDVTPVVETLAGMLHANVFFARLAAHGGATGAQFATVTAQDWLDDAREALAVGRRLGDRVVLIGTSTGALLATLAALEDNSPRLAALVLLSPNFGLRDWRAKFISGPLGRLLARIIIGREHSFRPDSPGHAEYWTSRLPAEGIVALMDLMNYARSIHLDHLEIPTLIIYTHKDTVVDTQAIQNRFDEIRGPAKLIIDLPEASRHELTGNALAPETVQPVVRRIMAFLADRAVLGPAFIERSR